jgi:carboxylate-amine ligase
MRNWSEYVWLVDHLIATGFIKSIREIWWDIRPHCEFGTVEVRVMDMPPNMRHLLALVALTQSLVAGISADIDRGAYLYDCHPLIAKQNKWHAARYGMDASFVDPGTMKAVTAAETARKLLELCRPIASDLGCAEEIEGINDIIEQGTGARQQVEVFRRANDAREVAQFLLRQEHADASAQPPGFKSRPAALAPGPRPGYESDGPHPAGRPR